ncbi:MAG: transpeptidase family protein [Alistipes sp.]|nr:transpeptidase family protein [Alistipes sp.]
MEDQVYKLKKSITRRIKVMHIIFICTVIYFLIHIVFGIFCDGTLREDAKAFESKVLWRQPLSPRRGTIYARNGEPLAVSITRSKLIIDFGNDRFKTSKTYKNDADTLARKLAAFFGDKSAKEYYEELISLRAKAIKTGKHISRAIFRDVDQNEWEEIRRYPLLRDGYNVTYSVQESGHRVYPQGNLALRTIGRANREKPYGIERGMNDTLQGKNGMQVWKVLAPGVKARIRHKENIEVEDGYDVVTTLDVDLQDVASAALEEQLIAQNANWGTTIVMEVSTGDILAMANLKRVEDRCVESRNYAIEIPINPGSTFKLLSAMALLEKGVPTTTKYDSELGRRVEIGNSKAWVQDSHAIGKETGGVIDMRKAFAESANVYFTRIIYDTFKGKPEEFSDFCDERYIGRSVGLEEYNSDYRKLKRFDKKHPSRLNALVNLAYGYGVDITPLHTITLYNAVANDGVMVAPRLVLRTERDGKVVEKADVKVLNDKICSRRTLDTLRMMMEDVSNIGTAAEFFGEKACNFRTGSKTGTAQINTTIDGVRYRKEDGYYYGSMVTYLPADKPRYTIMTAIFTKRQAGKFYYGASLTGPVQKRVATYLYNREMRNAASIDERDFTTNRKVVAKSSLEGVEASKGCVPQVVGMGLNDALYLLEDSGLTVDVVGCGRVVEQSLKAGTKIVDGNKRITIRLK